MNMMSKNAPVITVLILSLLAIPALAHESGEAHPHNDTAPKQATMPEQASTAASIMDTVKKAIENSKAAIEAKNLKTIHGYTSPAMDALRSLSSVATPAPEKKERLESTIKQMSAKLDALHDTADGGDITKTEAEFKKVEGAYKLLEIQLR